MIDKSRRQIGQRETQGIDVAAGGQQPFYNEAPTLLTYRDGTGRQRRYRALQTPGGGLLWCAGLGGLIGVADQNAGRHQHAQYAQQRQRKRGYASATASGFVVRG